MNTNPIELKFLAADGREITEAQWREQQGQQPARLGPNNPAIEALLTERSRLKALLKAKKAYEHELSMKWTTLIAKRRAR